MRRTVALAFLLLPAAAQDDFAAVKELIAKLGSSDVEMRVEAAYELSEMGPRAKGAAPALVKALGDESTWVAGLAFDALKKVGPDAVPAIAKGLSDRDDSARAAAMRLLDESFARDLKPYLRTIAGLLKDKSKAVRASAAHALGQQGEAAIDLLVIALGAREEGAQEAAVTGLVMVGGAAVDQLLRVLASGGDRSRVGAALALGALKADGAAAPLIAALSDKVPEAAGAAARALGEIGASPAELVPRLLEGLRHASAAYRDGCVLGLVAYGEPARDGLVAALDRDDARAAASLAILRGGDMGLAAVRDALGGSVAARHAALAIIRRMTPATLSDGVVAAAVDCLRHDDANVRADAARTLGHAGPRANGKELTGAADDPDPSVRAAAVASLGELGVDPGHLDDKDPVVRVEAQLASWRLGGGAGAGDLAKIAFDASAEISVRAAAVDALGRMGIGAGAIDLSPLAAGQPVEIRRAAVEAMAAITRPSALAIRDARAAARPDKTIAAALDWLTLAQGKDGEWEKDLFTSGTTGLALLAFLAAGSGPRDEKYGLPVRRGISYLISKQDKDGVMSTRATHEFLLCHGIATIALIEAWIVDGDDACRRAAQRGLDFIAWARNPDLAWRYDPRGGENDTHVTTWMVMALRLGDAAGLRVDPEAYAGASAWIERMAGGEGRIGYSYPGGQSARPEGLVERFPVEHVEPMTAAGLWCRQLIGGEPLKGRGHREGIDLLLSKPPRWSSGHQDRIYWSFGALALFQDGDATYGKWEKALTAALAAGREKSGAWAIDDVWGDDGGKVYTTAMSVLTLLTPTRYPRDFLVKPKLSAGARAAVAALKKACADEDQGVREAAVAACARLAG